MTAFNWRNYITLKDRNPENVAKTQIMLDRLASTEDGRALIQRAYEVSGPIEIASNIDQLSLGGKPIDSDIKISDQYNKGGALVLRNQGRQYEGKVIIDPSQPGRNGWSDDNGNTHVDSQTGVLVHELYHLADPNHLPHVKLLNSQRAIREEFDAYLETPTLNAQQRGEFLTALTAHAMKAQGLTDEAISRNPELIDDQLNAEVAFGRIMSGLEANPQALRNLGIPHADAPIRIRNVDAASRELREKGLGFSALMGSVAGEDEYTPSNTPRDNLLSEKAPTPVSGRVVSNATRFEEQAVDFTDQFMCRNFGVTVPRRGYENGVDTTGLQAPAEPLPLSSPQTCALPYTPDNTHPPDLPSPPRFPTVAQTTVPSR
jgi:hypothetical protein